MRDPDGLIARAGVRADPRADQHFLVDDRVLDRIPRYAVDAGADLHHVLEIGAGTGGLTARLLADADRVTAVERDPELVRFLREEFHPEIEAGTLTVVEGDALAVEFPEFTASISNLPYGISGEITFRLLRYGAPLVLMFQREFAERMVADPGTPEYGRLSVSARHFADVEIVERVPRTAFSPQPAVESAVVRMLPRPAAYSISDETFFLRFVKALFTQRRKTLRNAIRNTAHIAGLRDPDTVVAAVDPERLDRRPGELAPEEFAELAELAIRHGGIE